MVKYDKEYAEEILSTEGSEVEISVTIPSGKYRKWPEKPYQNKKRGKKLITFYKTLDGPSSKLKNKYCKGSHTSIKN